MSAHRRHIHIAGFVQGVGFRPFLHRLAERFGLAGRAWNTLTGVETILEGDAEALDGFLRELQSAPPRLASLQQLRWTETTASGLEGFTIEPSRSGERRRAWVLPDADLCQQCEAEILDPSDRRFGHPFTSCVHCGPRYSIVTDIPYDRNRTTMAAFELCPDCRREYEDPRDRRHHAQPVACPACGPRLWLVDSRGREVAAADPLIQTAEALDQGQIVAIRGLGGFHLAVDAAHEEAIAQLRERKRRPAKPLAMMVADLDAAHALAVLDSEEERELLTPARPILLVEPRPERPLAPGVAPGLDRVGLMIAYTPLHRLLLEAFRKRRPEGEPAALIMTSGNRAGAPICADNDQALADLGSIADLFLLHDRPIAGPCDDSVGQVHRGQLRLFRRARGFVPAPLLVERRRVPAGILALGGELKVSIALSRESEVIAGRYLGDLVDPVTRDAFLADIDHLLHLTGVEPAVIAHDLHPDFVTTRHARQGFPAALPRQAVQHHHAHLASCLLEHDLPEGLQALGIILDGTGFGPDGTIWGGELLLGDAAEVRRAAHFAAVALPGGDAAIRHPRRVGFAYLYEAFGADWERLELPLLRQEDETRLATLRQMLDRGLNAPRSSGAGRLFDAVTALLDLPAARGEISYEGEAAIALEQLALSAPEATAGQGYPVDRAGEVLDFSPTIRAIVDEVGRGVDRSVIAARFHATVARACAVAADEIRQATGVEVACLSGGVFQNRLLLELMTQQLEADRWRVLINHRFPPNDGGIAPGQVAVAAARIARGDIGKVQSGEREKR